MTGIIMSMITPMIMSTLTIIPMTNKKMPAAAVITMIITLMTRPMRPE